MRKYTTFCGGINEDGVRKSKKNNLIPYFSIDNAHLMYNAHPKLFRHSFLCIDNEHDAN
jgi:hypothetical protein